VTKELFRDDSYLQSCTATVTSVSDNVVHTDQTIFYPLGGGQPGDTGAMRWDGGSAKVIDTRYVDGDIGHILEDGVPPPATGTSVELEIDWDRRYRHMRMHTAMHLLGSVLKYGVTGSIINAEKSRLDFDMQDAVDKEAVAAAMATLIAANPELVRTMSVQPPRGKGAIRLLEIEGVDLQPCGGTHLRSTAEVGSFRIGKVENKGRQNRRVNIHLDD
jgi:misacylated tRNA(Ala) deacylase